MAVRLFGNRRGMFFTLVAILIITVVFVSFSPEYSSTIDYQTEVTQSRVEAANELVETIKYSYVPAAIEASSYHALKWLSHDLKGSGSGFSNRTVFNESFEWMMMNGTQPRVPYDEDKLPYDAADPPAVIYPGMEKVHFRNLLAELETASRDYSQIETNFTTKNFNLSLYQNRETGAFQVGVNLTINFSVDAGLARWDDLENISVFFEFEGIEDPLYAIHDTGHSGYVNVFNATNLTNYNISNTLLAIEQRTYRYAGERLVAGPDKAKYHGPSFLDRFVDGDNVNNGGSHGPDGLLLGNTEKYASIPESEDYSACCGLESLINPHLLEMNIPAGDVKNFNSYVDWCYFSLGTSECNNYIDPDISPTPPPAKPKILKCITTGGFTSPKDGSDHDFPATAIYDNFKLDSLHVGTYNLSYINPVTGTTEKYNYDPEATAAEYGSCPTP